MNPSIEKRPALKAAIALLDRKDDDSWRYAALELRRCIEAEVYDLLSLYDKWLPLAAKKAWQPPQAFKALLQVEPDADKTGEIFVSLDAQGDIPPAVGPTRLGMDQRPSHRWLNKTYNTLGNMLHARWPYSDGKTWTAHSAREQLCRIAKELTPLVESTMCAIGNVVDFNCEECGAVVCVSRHALAKGLCATCLSCESSYEAVEKEGEFTFKIVCKLMPCPACHGEMGVPLRRCADGYKFSCDLCGSKFELGNSWFLLPDENAISETVP